jgi:hypothetical protein
VRSFKTYNPTTGATFTDTGVGGAVSAAIEPVKPVRLVGTAFFSSGGGRYIANTNLPDLIVNANASITLVGTRAFLVGVEIQGGPRTSAYGYHSQAHADRATTTDVDGSAIGFGIEGSTAANEQIEETTAGVTQTFFRDPKIGGIQFMAQYSYLRRVPFAVTAGTPARAAANMLYFNLRYLLP